ncbi:VWA domain-containing protein [Blastococcus sp. Marseille-P5729]|uniref:vWA domain-containing protein n=1 Tax=Blastococcus sp. Marseille-P5729 TaxID=2086582 RepID=UPI000D0ED688|nr:VWA domain-containing protein [Blastococcus sp. Marseille-P5729]
MTATVETKGLLAHLTGFVGALREAGIPVGVGECVDTASVLAAVDVLEREDLREGLAAVCVKRPAYRLAFDTMFDLWWPLATGEGVAIGKGSPDGEGDPDSEADAEAAGDGQPDIDAWREALAKALMDGDSETLKRLARNAVAQLGKGAAGGGRESYYSYRVMRALSPDTLVAQLLDGLLNKAESERGGMQEQVARQTIRDRLAEFRRYVDAEVRRRVAEDRGKEQVAKTTIRPMADQVDFLRAQSDDLAELRRTVHPLARRLASRLSARRRLGRSGRLDFRRTVRSSLATGGIPINTHHKPRKQHKPELVVLCDVSGSVAGFSHFTLMLTAALREQFSKVRAFAFVDTTDEVTSFFTPGEDLPTAVQRIGSEANLVWFDGHSDYGHSFEVFEEKWPEAIGPKTSLLILGDARSNYRDPALSTLKQMVSRARHAYWLNPEAQRMWGSGDSVANRYAEVIEMKECRTAQQLADFVHDMLPGA